MRFPIGKGYRIGQILFGFSPFALPGTQDASRAEEVDAIPRTGTRSAPQNRERVPERMVYARGTAAYGTLTYDITRYSKAAVFSSKFHSELLHPVDRGLAKQWVKRRLRIVFPELGYDPVVLERAYQSLSLEPRPGGVGDMQSHFEVVSPGPDRLL